MEEADKQLKEEFYVRLQDVLDKRNKHDLLIVTGDMNDKVGEENWDHDNRAVHSGGAKGAVAPARKTKCFFSNIVSDFAGLFLVAILVRNLTKTEFAPADKKS